MNITTAIDYVNSTPHIGHAFEKVVADVVVRWHRLRGVPVSFLTGTDENAQKNKKAAEEHGVSVDEFINSNAQAFIGLCYRLNISWTKFVRTTDPHHHRVCKDIFKRLYDKKDIYKGDYKGRYCQGCEAFLTDKDLVNGKCPEHNREPVLVSEDCFFFGLSKYEDQIVEFVSKSVFPEQRRNEILQRIKIEGLKDICVSRKGDWGVTCPVDQDYKIYVWFDALLNYLSGECHPATHFVGKGINWFHSVIWPGILLSARLPLPQRIVVHGYLTFDGQKQGKSLGNTIDPIALIDAYGSDVVRYSLLRCSVFEDSDYGERLLIDRNNKELANKFGNLVWRVTTLAAKYGIVETTQTLVLDTEHVDKVIRDFSVDQALIYIFAFIDKCNEFVEINKPWEIFLNQDKSKGQSDLWQLVQAIKTIVIVLSPFLPESCAKIASDMGFPVEWSSIEKPLYGCNRVKYKLSKIE